MSRFVPLSHGGPLARPRRWVLVSSASQINGQKGAFYTISCRSRIRWRKGCHIPPSTSGLGCRCGQHGQVPAFRSHFEWPTNVSYQFLQPLWYVRPTLVYSLPSIGLLERLWQIWWDADDWKPARRNIPRHGEKWYTACIKTPHRSVPGLRSQIYSSH